MSHGVHALVVTGPVDSGRARSVGLRAVLTHGDITVFPIGHCFSAYWAAERGNSALLDLPDGLPGLFPNEAVLRDLAGEATGRGVAGRRVRCGGGGAGAWRGRRAGAVPRPGGPCAVDRLDQPLGAGEQLVRESMVIPKPTG
jgi:hypothetical protein